MIKKWKFFFKNCLHPFWVVEADENVMNEKVDRLKINEDMAKFNCF